VPRPRQSRIGDHQPVRGGHSKRVCLSLVHRRTMAAGWTVHLSSWNGCAAGIRRYGQSMHSGCDRRQALRRKYIALLPHWLCITASVRINSIRSITICLFKHAVSQSWLGWNFYIVCVTTVALAARIFNSLHRLHRFSLSFSWPQFICSRAGPFAEIPSSMRLMLTFY